MDVELSILSHEISPRHIFRLLFARSLSILSHEIRGDGSRVSWTESGGGLSILSHEIS